MGGHLQAAGTVVSIRQVLKTRYDHVPGSCNSYSHIVFLAHSIRSILVQEVCYFSYYLLILNFYHKVSAELRSRLFNYFTLYF